MLICYFMTLITPRELYCTHSVFSLLPSPMSIQFKFRSSVNFDSIDIGREGLSSISLKDLRSRIALHNNLNLSRDFDLVISDARTGQVLDDDEFQIPTGTRIIIKRVPAGSTHDPPAPVELFKCSEVQTKKQEDTFKPPPVGTVVENFDDFGDDICPANELVFLDSDLYTSRVDSFSDEKKNFTIPRCAGLKFGASDESEANPIVFKHDGIVQNLASSKLRSAEKLINQDKLEIVIPPPLRDSDFPVELKCSLCHTYFKEAVMIPCCQHSIRSVLVEKARCPKCSSTKCRVEDLLPNVSLRQAIEHFRGSQILHNDSENNLPRYAPDGESGIQGKDVSCAMPTFRREPDLAHSPSASGNGSNQIVAEPICEPRSKRKVAVSGSALNAGAGKSLELAPIDHTKQVFSTIKTPRVSWQNAAGRFCIFLQECLDDRHLSTCFSFYCFLQFNGTNNGFSDEYHRFAGISGQKKSERTCYRCGSPDHLIRDCPAAHGPPPMHITGDAMFSRAMPGYALPFWTGTPLPHPQPFAFYGYVCDK
ncbi:Zinc finger, CCHC-type, partial [Dillenia turbinata]